MADRMLLVMAKRDGRYIAGAINFIGSRHAVRPPLGRDRAPSVPAFRGLLLSGDRLRDRSTSSPASRPAPRASTSSRAATCRRRPIRRITSPIRRCAARSPTISSASAPMWRPRAPSLPRCGPFRKDLGCEHVTMTIAPGERTMPSYDPNNIFAKILRGELPCHKVYEDDKALAFLDIMPRAPGHTLVMPKAPGAQLARRRAGRSRPCDQVAQKIARGRDEGFWRRRHHHPAVQRERRRTGRVSPAFSCHPAQEGVPMKPPASVKEDNAVLSDQAAKLAAALNNHALQDHAPAMNRVHRPVRRQTPSRERPETPQTRSLPRLAGRSAAVSRAVPAV